MLTQPRLPTPCPLPIEPRSKARARGGAQAVLHEVVGAAVARAEAARALLAELELRQLRLGLRRCGAQQLTLEPREPALARGHLDVRLVQLHVGVELGR